MCPEGAEAEGPPRPTLEFVRVEVLGVMASPPRQRDGGAADSDGGRSAETPA